MPRIRVAINQLVIGERFAYQGEIRDVSPETVQALVQRYGPDAIDLKDGSDWPTIVSADDEPTLTVNPDSPIPGELVTSGNEVEPPANPLISIESETPAPDAEEDVAVNEVNHDDRVFNAQDPAPKRGGRSQRRA